MMNMPTPEGYIEPKGYVIYAWGDIAKAHKLTMKYRHFICPYCGCDFDADKNHYEYHSGGYNEEWYTTICPCCENKISSDE